MKTVYVTKYALTGGIEKCCVRSLSKGYAYVLYPGSRMPVQVVAADWHENLADAIERAHELRIKKITSAKKQIQRLEAMRFDEEAVKDRTLPAENPHE